MLSSCSFFIEESYLGLDTGGAIVIRSFGGGRFKANFGGGSGTSNSVGRAL